jgi:release factor glutamine methyltransferase
LKDWTILEILNWTKDFFKSKQIENPRLNAEMIIASVLDLNRLDLYMNYDVIVSEENRKVIKQSVKRRSQLEPLQYILGFTEFYGYKFKVDPSVLIPRPETEYLVEKIIENRSGVNSILDIGTGSGCIAITLARELKDVKIDAVDLYPDAIDTAIRNAEINEAEVTFFRSDLFSNVKNIYDIIVSNPPYISKNSYQELSEEIRNFEPETALLADELGLYYYRKILEDARNFLQEGGRIFFEIGYDQSEAIKFIAEKNGFRIIEIIKDLNGFDRIMILG